MHDIESKRQLSVSIRSSLGAAMALVLGLLSVCGVARPAYAQDAAEAAMQADPLVSKQTSVAARYARLEELLLRLADVEGRENPERAALLRRVARQSRERFVLEKLRGASTLIASGQLSKALEDQKTASGELDSLLKLLLSEDRSSRIRDEKKRIADMIKQLRLTERNERSVRARTENGVELAEVLKEQEDLTKRAEALNQQFRDDDANESSDSEDVSDSNETSDSKDADSSQSTEPDDSMPPGEKPEADDRSEKSEPPASKDEFNPQEMKDKPDASEKQEPSEKTESGEQKGASDLAKPGEPQPSSGQPSPDAPSEPKEPKESPEQSAQGQAAPTESPQQPKSPEQDAQDQLEKAIERMKQAQEKLAQEQRGEATQEQRQAEEELRKAIDKLEKILRQLREEEIQRELAKLESRLRKMAAMQSSVLDQTEQLAQTPQSQRDRTTDLKSGDLAFEEQKITLEADRAMLLLKEEGSSVAFPEVLQQLREDTRRVTTRLGQSKIDAVTQGIQNDILAALEEMISALAKAQRDHEKKQQQQQQQGQPGGQGAEEEPLVQVLAELKLLRTMQTRIHGTTDRYGNLLQQNEAGEASATGEDVLPLLRDLAQRQDRLYQITRDLVTKRNQ